MTDTQKINKLWAQFREAINLSYKVSQRPGNALDLVTRHSGYERPASKSLIGGTLWASLA
jgi:hypothetical protein